MWVIEIETGKKKNIRCAEFIADWLNEKPKYKEIEKKQGLTKSNLDRLHKMQPIFFVHFYY